MVNRTSQHKTAFFVWRFFAYSVVRGAFLWLWDPESLTFRGLIAFFAVFMDRLCNRQGRMTSMLLTQVLPSTVPPEVLESKYGETSGLVLPCSDIHRRKCLCIGPCIGPFMSTFHNISSDRMVQAGAYVHCQAGLQYLFHLYTVHWNTSPAPMAFSRNLPHSVIFPVCKGVWSSEANIRSAAWRSCTKITPDAKLHPECGLQQGILTKLVGACAEGHKRACRNVFLLRISFDSLTCNTGHSSHTPMSYQCMNKCVLHHVILFAWV